MTTPSPSSPIEGRRMFVCTNDCRGKECPHGSCPREPWMPVEEHEAAMEAERKQPAPDVEQLVERARGLQEASRRFDAAEHQLREADTDAVLCQRTGEYLFAFRLLQREINAAFRSSTPTQPNPIGDREQLRELAEDCTEAAAAQDRSAMSGLTRYRAWRAIPAEDRVCGERVTRRRALRLSLPTRLQFFLARFDKPKPIPEPPIERKQR